MLKSLYYKFYWTIVSIIDYISFNLKFKHVIANNKKNILIFGHDGSTNGGASVVLNNLLKNINMSEYNVFMFFKNGGPLVNESKNIGNNAYVYQYLYKKYINKFYESGIEIKAILVNTSVCANIIDVAQDRFSCPIVWWIHEGQFLKDYPPKKFDYLRDNVRLVSVSENSKKILQDYYPDRKIDIIHYGLNDEYKESYTKHLKNKMFTIDIVGMLTERKNQKQIIEMLKNLPKEITDKLRIRMISGTWDNQYRDSLMKEASEFKQVEFIPGLSHKKLIEEYTKIDLLICCSKDDPLPVVVTEALMMKCICLVSSGCGQYEYIVDGINGYKYIVDDINELCSKIIKIMNCSENELVAIKKNGRKLYEEVFSMKKSVGMMASCLELR